MKWTIKEQQDGRIDGLEVPRIVEQLLLHRGIDTKEKAERFFTPDYERDLHDPFLFTDMQKVVARFEKAQAADELVGIFGDHDVDGISGATVLTEGLQALGIRVEAYIPDKHGEGHGINTRAINHFAAEGVTLLVSVDCGSTDIEPVAYAKEKGMDTIIIDHHNAPEVLPDAHAIINPKVPGSGYPFSGICGTGAAFKVITALFHAMAPEQLSQLKWLLDVVSIGTVADCMPLLDENRTMVKYGLLVLSKTRRIAYEEMIAVGRIPISPEKLPDAQTIAFQIAPRLNAAGRMARARDAYEFLVEQDRAQARVRALDLEEKNQQRRKITDTIVKEVDSIVQAEFADASSVVIDAEHYPIGVIGIIAGRIASSFGKPTGIFHKGETESQGSFRGIEGVSLVDALRECEDLLVKFGGHDQAAGATLLNENMDAFRTRFAAAIEKQLAAGLPEVTLSLDAVQALEDVDHTLLSHVKQFAPFGQDNPEPLFLFEKVLLVEKRFVGNGEKHVKLSLRPHDKSPQVFDAIWFGAGKSCDDFHPGATLDIAAHIQENEWNGNVSIQLMVVDIRLTDD